MKEGACKLGVDMRVWSSRQRPLLHLPFLSESGNQEVWRSYSDTTPNMFDCKHPYLKVHGTYNWVISAVSIGLIEPPISAKATPLTQRVRCPCIGNHRSRSLQRRSFAPKNIPGIPEGSEASCRGIRWIPSACVEGACMCIYIYVCICI